MTTNTPKVRTSTPATSDSSATALQDQSAYVRSRSASDTKDKEWVVLPTTPFKDPDVRFIPFETEAQLKALVLRLVDYGGWFEVRRDSVNGSMVRVGKEFIEDVVPLCSFYSVGRQGELELIGEFISTAHAWKYLEKHHKGHEKVIVLNSDDLARLIARANKLLSLIE